MVILLKKNRRSEGVQKAVNIRSIRTIFVLGKIRQRYSSYEEILRLKF